MAARKAWREWKTTDVAFLTEHYPEKGGIWCARQMDRAHKAVMAKANDLGLHRAAYQPKPLAIESGLLDEAIRRAYRQPQRGAIARVASQFGVSRQCIARRALKIGARATMRSRAWSEREIELIRQNAQASNEQMVAILAGRGFSRTAFAVKQARVDHDVDRTDSELHTLGDVARLLGVDHSTPSNWLKRGLLIPEKGTGGDDGRVKISDLEIARFIVTNPLIISMPKLEGSKEWFIDLLARKGALAAMSKPKSQREAVLQAAQAHPNLSPRQIAELLEMDVRVARVVISKLRADGLLPSTREAA